jgi:signal transduction histidine kinase
MDFIISDEKQRTTAPRVIGSVLAAGAVIVLLYLSSLPNYLLFHTISEMFSIVIAAGFFMVAWNSRPYQENKYLTYLGIAYLFIALLDLFHTLTYKGINLFPGNNDYATRLWIAARYVESVTLFIIFLSVGRRKGTMRYGTVFFIYAAVTLSIFISIFAVDVFPICFRQGTGLTPFKIASEYIISSILVVTGVVLYWKRPLFESKVFRWLFWSIALTAASELAFTFYIDVYGISNFVGHLFKIGSFYLIYKAIIETGLVRPMDLIFTRLKTANEEKDKFFSIIAHDLKNPFGGISSMSRLLVNEWSELDDAERYDYISSIKETSEVSLSLLNNLLMWARVQTGRLTPKPQELELSILIGKSIQLHKSSAEKKNIDIKTNVPEEIIVFGDWDMIDFVIRNLISNAVKFTPAGGTVQIEAGEKDRTAVISISDTGVGMTADQIGSAFTVGESRSSKGTANEEGTGLGLILCKEFVERNNGELIVESTPGRGSTFRIILPATNLFKKSKKG